MPQIAGRLGISTKAAENRWHRARKYLDLDPAIKKAMTAVGTGMVPSVVWDKTQPGYSVLLRPAQESATAVDWLEAIMMAVNSVTPLEARPTKHAGALDNLLTVYPLFDAHIGMLAWGKETGGADYDLALAASDMRAAFDGLDAITPASGKAVLILGGDTLHADDNRAETPHGKNKLDVDSRQFKAIEAALQIICDAIDRLASKHGHLTVRVLRGNHDEHSHMVLTFALTERYRLIGNVTVDKDPRDLFMMQHGVSLIAAHHGDKVPPQRLAMHVADVCPWWSATKDRHILTGHIHHDSTKDLGGVKWHSLRAFCPPDNYGAPFSSRRALTAMTFDARKGLVLNGIEGVMR